MRAPPPLVVAHRGASAEHPEHTLAAYEEAVAAGADALECDVRLTRDGVLVCVHDRRLERTSTGTGSLSTRSLADLAELDFGSWRSVGVEEEEGLDVPARRRVLTLERLLQLAVDSGDGLELHVETKHPTRYGPAVERGLVALLDRYGLANPRPGRAARVTVMSFAPVALLRTATLAPRLPRVLLTDRVPRWLATGRLPVGVDVLGLSVEALRADPSYVQRVQERGRRLHVWTVNRGADIAMALDAGVDAVISDRPAAVRAAVDARLPGST